MSKLLMGHGRRHGIHPQRLPLRVAPLAREAVVITEDYDPGTIAPTDP